MAADPDTHSAHLHTQQLKYQVRMRDRILGQMQEMILYMDLTGDMSDEFRCGRSLGLPARTHLLLSTTSTRHACIRGQMQESILYMDLMSNSLLASGLDTYLARLHIL